MVRPALPEDLPRLRDIERAAGEPFRDLGMALIADADLPIIDEPAVYESRGRAWSPPAEQSS
jgi:hypothetical protein